MNKRNGLDLALRINHATPEQIAQAMERLPTDVLEWAVKFEALSTPAPASAEGDDLARGDTNSQEEF